MPVQTTTSALRIDCANQRVTFRDQLILLTRQEFLLVEALALDPDRVFTRSELSAAMWGEDDQRSLRAVEAIACRVRAKLAASDDLIENIWGVGYRLRSLSSVTEFQFE